MKRPGAFRNSHLSMGGEKSRVLLIVKCFSVFHDTIPQKKLKLELCSAISRAAYSKLAGSA